jgi:hypothetical protein
MKQLQRLNQIGEKHIGMLAQSGLLTMIGDKGQKVLQPAQKITGYEIVYNFGEPELMFIINGDSVYENTCFNFKKE